MALEQRDAAGVLLLLGAIEGRLAEVGFLVRVNAVREQHTAVNALQNVSGAQAAQVTAIEQTIGSFMASSAPAGMAATTASFLRKPACMFASASAALEARNLDQHGWNKGNVSRN